MPPPQGMTLDFRPEDEQVAQAGFTSSITPDTITITDTVKVTYPVKDDIEAPKLRNSG
jgi:hypothetical protein